MKTNENFRRLRALVTAGRALLTDTDRKMIAQDVDAKDRRAAAVALSVLHMRFTEESNQIGQQFGAGRNRELFARVGLLKDALPALDRRNVELVIDLLLTTRTGLFMLNSTDGRLKPGVPMWTGKDLAEGKAMFAKFGVNLFKRGDAFFETSKFGFTEEVPVIRLFTFGAWEVDERTKALEAAQLEVDYAERGLEEVQNRCEAEPGDWVSQQLADERRACSARVFDAHLKLRLVQLGKPDLAWKYECGEIPVSSYDDRGPVEIAESLVIQVAA